LCLNSEAEIRLCLFSDFHYVCAIEQQKGEIDMQSLEDSLEEHDKRKAAIGSSGMTPQKKKHASRLPERKVDPLNLPNLQLVVKSNLKTPRLPPFAPHSSLYSLPVFSNWEEAFMWFNSGLGLHELAIEEIKELYGNLTAIIFLKDAVVDQHETANEIQIDLMHGLLDLFGSEHISYKPGKSYNAPRMIFLC
jgi:hypothetical protein